MGHIREGVRKYKDKAASDAQMKANINLLKQCTANTTMGSINLPTKAIRNQLATMAISQQPANQPTQDGIFGSAGGGGGNLFNARATRPPASEEEKVALKTSLALYPSQPETPEGEAAYLDQLRAWCQVNGEGHISRMTVFPLCPGGAPPGSRECYNCGQMGHRHIDCQTMGIKKIPQLEATF